MTASLFPGQSDATAIGDPPSFILTYTYKLIFSGKRYFIYSLKLYFHSIFLT